ncbi:helix-turn-helix transcriptional regulator [Campylobacter aviculae]|uniref:DNA-binding protein n=1 Tax=Campylobacter aviculae TaxID=2510190 RepID=A0A4U7BTC0_9BACT|nr:helix-turn-helix domain-containing protein [Campylobacter aviculae]TKX32426.1 DNA-binding protein [Campylobacter aviculae]
MVKLLSTLLSTKEVAEYLGYHKDTIRKMRMRKNQSKYNFPQGFKIGGTIKYEKSEIDQWYKSRRVS